MSRKDKGWEFLNSNDISLMADEDNGDTGYSYSDGSSYYNGADGSWGSKNSDGSGFYDGADGSWGSKNADGSGFYDGTDGSWGIINSDGSSSYHGADGSYGYRNADGSGSFHDADGNTSFYDRYDNYNDNYDDDDIEDESDFSDTIGKVFEAAAAMRAVNKAQKQAYEEELRAKEREIELKEREKRYEENRILRAERRAWRKKHKKGICITIVIILIATLSAYGYSQYKKYIPIGYSSESLKGMHYEDVMDKLYSAGFYNISWDEISDLPVSQDNEDNLVTEVRLGSKDSFDEDTKYPYDKEITIVYHTVKLYNPPIISKEAKDQNYLDVLKAFEDAGFINITPSAEYDILTGWLIKDGAVKSVTINGEKNYETYDRFRPDVDVVITYHTLAKNKPK